MTLKYQYFLLMVRKKAKIICLTNKHDATNAYEEMDI
jgi:hypothetical protein